MINICFHGIGRPQRDLEPGEGRYWISADLYARVLDEISDRTDVQISFDDGNVSDIETGLEGLRQHRRTAAFFVLAGRLDQPGSLTSDNLRELVRSGMSVGSHGMDHVPWRSLSENRRRREFVEARHRISDAAGSQVDEAALPLGRYDRRTLTHLRQLGYRRVFSSDRQPNRPGAWLQHRFSIRADDTIHGIRGSILTPQAGWELAQARGKSLLKRLR